MSFLTYVMFVLLLGTSAHTQEKADIESLETYLPVELNIPVVWVSCGSWNGGYYPGLKMIELCEENLALPDGAARVIFLHELGHAYTVPEGDFKRWSGNYEDAADEFAMVATVLQGHPDDLLVMARVWDQYAKENPPTPGDPHSPASARAARLRHFYLGYMGFGPYFPDYADTLDYWHARFVHTLESPRGPA